MHPSSRKRQHPTHGDKRAKHILLGFSLGLATVCVWNSFTFCSSLASPYGIIYDNDTPQVELRPKQLPATNDEGLDVSVSAQSAESQVLPAQPPHIWSMASYEGKLRTPDGKYLPRESHPDEPQLKWRVPGKFGRAFHDHRHAIEVVTYGLAGVLPYYAEILPALRFKDGGRIFTNTTRVEIAVVPNLLDVILDLHECSPNGNGSSVNGDGFFNACYSPPENNDTRAMVRNKNGLIIGASEASYEHCYIEGHREGKTFKPIKEPENRKIDFPAPGHEKWSCGDHNIMEQLVAALVLDVFTGHGDRFRETYQTNLFVLQGQQPVTFVSIDHDPMELRFFTDKIIHKTQPQMLLGYDMSARLREEIRVALASGKEDFVRKINETIWGQLDNLERVVRQIGEAYDKSTGIQKPRPTNSSVVDTLWRRLALVANYYDI